MPRWADAGDAIETGWTTRSARASLAPALRSGGRAVRGTGERWFVPGTPICRVHADASMFVGVQSVVLQSLHPLAMGRRRPAQRIPRRAVGALATHRRLHRRYQRSARPPRPSARSASSVASTSTSTALHPTAGRTRRSTHICSVGAPRRDRQLLAAHTHYGNPRSRVQTGRVRRADGFVARQLGVPAPPESERALRDRSVRTGRSCGERARRAKWRSTMLVQPPMPLPAATRRTSCSAPPRSRSCRGARALCGALHAGRRTRALRPAAKRSHGRCGGRWPGDRQQEPD